MGYVKNFWINLPEKLTKINATRLNHLETQYDEAKAYADQLAFDAVAAPSDLAVSLMVANPASATRAALESYEYAPTGVLGRKYKFVAGVIRNPGSAWDLIANATHRAQNVDAITNDTTKITIDYTSIGASRVVSFVAVPDETLAASGFFIGSSVDTHAAELTLSRYRRVNDYVSWGGSSFSSQNSVFTVTSFTAGVLELAQTIPMSGPNSAFPIALTARGGSAIPTLSTAVGPLANNVVKIEFRDYAGTLLTTGSTGMRVFIDRGTNLTVADPTTVTTSAFPNSNIWFMGIFEV